jgi:hypothetical protein
MSKDKKMDKLNDLLLQCMTNDLYDPDKCSPGLYQVVRGYLNDNKELLEGIPKESLEFLEDKLSDSIPFKKEAS